MRRPLWLSILFSLGCGAAGSSGAAPREPDVSLNRAMVQVVRGERSLASLVDRDRGLVYVLWQVDASDQDPRRDPDGVIREASRLCGAELDAALARLDADLQRRNRDPSDEPSIACEGPVCRHPALMEYDVEGEYVFHTVAPPVLDRVVRVEGHLDDAGEAAARRWVEAQLSALADGACAR